MKKLIVIIGLFTFLLYPLKVYPALFDPAVKWRTIETRHFAIHYAEELEDIAQRVARIAEELHMVMSQEFDWTPKGRTQVLLLDNHDTANGSASVLPYNWILLRVSAPRPNTSLDYYDDWLRMLFAHEYTHILHLDQHQGVMSSLHLVLGKLVSPNGLTPGWMREGMAVFEESKQSGMGRVNSPMTDMILRTDVFNNKLLKIDQADGLGVKWPAGYGMYYYGGRFIQWLVDKYGEEKLMQLNKVIAGSPFLFMLNAQSRTVYNTTFYKLWREWQRELKERYDAEIAEISKKGMTELKEVAKNGTILSLPTPIKGSNKIIYACSTVDKYPTIMLKDLDTGEEKILEKRKLPQQISVSPDGNSYVYSALGASDIYSEEKIKGGYYYYSGIYLKEFGKKKATVLKTGRRASDPDFSPDGRELIYVTTDKGTQRLSIYNIETKESTDLPVSTPQFTQFSNPRFSPDGKYIAVSVWLEGGNRDIFIYKRSGELFKRVTNDKAIDSHPTWDPQGKYIYFSSFRTGVANIFRYDLKKGDLVQMTNVVTGVFQPFVSADGRKLFVQYYNGRGYDIRTLDISSSPPLEKQGKAKRRKRGAAQTYFQGIEKFEGLDSKGAPGTVAERPAETEAVKEIEEVQRYPSKRYTALGSPLLRPRFIMPTVNLAGEALIIGGMTGGSDPLRWHSWTAGVNYRTDSEHVGYFFNYIYNRLKPVFNMGIVDYSVDFGNLRFIDTTNNTTYTVRYYEKRTRGYAGLYVPFKNHTFGVQYFYDDHRSIPSLPQNVEDALNLGVFAGLNAVYTFSNAKSYPASISPESGRIIRWNFMLTDSFFGSAEKNEQQVFAGEWREYIGLGRHHVLALKVAGGITWGDTLVQGTFGFGGALGEGNLAGGGSLFYFPFRGLPVSTLARTRALLFSGEYRLPIISPERGLGTMPFYVKHIYFAPFVDYGNAWNAHENDGQWFFENFFLSTGAELRGDFVLGHGMPLTGRLGYGIVVLNRDRLGSLEDTLFKYQVKYGMLILQFGTSF